MDNQGIYTLESAVNLRHKVIDEIEERQLVFLKQHLKQALGIPFYKELYAANNIEIELIRKVQDLSLLPLTSRKDLDTRPTQFGLQDRVKILDIALTSGTTGEAVVVPYTRSDLQRLAFNEAVAFNKIGVGAGDRVLLTVTLDRCFIAGMAYYSGVTLLGATAIRSGPGQPARQWQIIEKLEPRVIVGVPTFLRDMGKWGASHGIDVAASSIEIIVTIGEPVRKADHTLTALGRDLERQWNAGLFSSYGATEFETAFCDCREFSGGHVHPELMLVEIVDDEGGLVADGTPGEVVVTPLGVEGFPLVRFRTGDVARLDSSPCSCGWNSKRLGAIEGRLAQRLKYKGTTLYPETIFHVLQDMKNVSGAYVEVRSAADGVDDITVVVGCLDRGVVEKEIVDKLQANLRARPSVILKTSSEVLAVMHMDGGRKPKKFFDFRMQ